jgi:formylglycine-generating enzyme required for sulfatase activity
MVTWYQAMAFCRWLSDKLGQTITLPHEVEWEVAARWPDGRFYPWGNQFDSTKANTREGIDVGQPTAVGLYPHGVNPELNLYDLSGNVWEWCRNKYQTPDDEGIDDSNDWRVLRGGSFLSLANRARAAYRANLVPGNRSGSNGFRLVVVRLSPSYLDH